MKVPGKQHLLQYSLKHHPAWVAAYDFYFNSTLKASWGGPFNGQEGRQHLFRELIANVKLETIVETGTFRGTTTEFFAAESGLPVYTVESNPRFFYYAKRRLRRWKSVRVELGDSRTFLERLVSDASVSKRNAFFYLDSHWGDDLPLKREVELISKNWHGVVIMIDDFEVPGDSGYGFDEYPPERLCLNLLQPLSALGLTAFFPTLPSEQETGRKRGSVILADRSLVDSLLKVKSLRIEAVENEVGAITPGGRI